jgi:formylglycine-generating enzyme required for sulfatase activity
MRWDDRAPRVARGGLGLAQEVGMVRRQLIASLPASLLLLAGCAALPSPAAHPIVAISGTAAIPGVADAMPPSVVAKPSPVGSMVRIHEASALMGSDMGQADERPVHEVHVAAFDMDLTEVTVSQYEGCVLAGACVAAGSTASWLGITAVDSELYADECNRDRADRQDYAANCVDWSMADAYCRWAGKRLPTEEEWEYAACGGDCNLALNSGNERSIVRGAARWPWSGRVARGRPGVFGLYDMAGNVWEWTASRYCSYDHPGCDDARRVVRGGSWSLIDEQFVRLTDRAPSDPVARNTNLGFRCARDDAPAG